MKMEGQKEPRKETKPGTKEEQKQKPKETMPGMKM